ncbi:UDP-glucuronosyltransferase 1A1-like [Salvelinus fontinalis]|uniref:UDP-glucuronosyltransferase 1A1-like n=1 Tax=Salvelinus fontinalis TaxID=8038 RepID=UPI002485CAB6|nr:UDP-glucuronosyltransferase 1A1-like [Salvelinus fontinalis]
MAQHVVFCPAPSPGPSFANLAPPLSPWGSRSPSLYSLFIHNCPLCGVEFEASQCPFPASYVPSHYTDHMTLRQRSANFLLALLEPLSCRYLYSGVNPIASDVLQRETTGPQLMSKTSIWLMCFDFSPPAEKAQQFFDVFRQVLQRVVWRYIGAVPENPPENVKVISWLPQNDLLGHPTVKALITHGVIHGIHEGICNGVPIVMMPLFGDQCDNVQRMAAQGVGKVLSINDVTSDKILKALNKIINDKTYKKKITKLWAVHKDCPVNPFYLAIFWTEYIKRHKGAGHVTAAAHELNWIQYHCLDLFTLLIILVITVVMATVKPSDSVFTIAALRSWRTVTHFHLS